MKFVIDIPESYITENELYGKEFVIPIIPTYTTGYPTCIQTNICLQPYEEPEITAKNDIIEALEILRDNMIEVGDTFTGMIESMRREHG